MDPRNLAERIAEYVSNAAAEIGIELWPIKIEIAPFHIRIERHTHYEDESSNEYSAIPIVPFIEYEDENGERWITR